jgi:hypothetical protein
MKLPVSLLAIVSLGLSIIGCGAGKEARTSSVAGGSVSASRTSGATIAFGIARSVRGLMGDNDDDEIESKTTGAKPGGDSDNDNDNDIADNAGKGYYDKDDGPISSFGHAADTRDERALVAVVKRYYEAAAAGDGATACSLTYPVLAKSIPEDYGQEPGPAYLRGAKTCAAVMSLLFTHEHRQLTAALEVTVVRMGGGEALVLLGSKTVPSSFVVLRRSHGAWRIDELLGFPMP